MTLFFKKSFFYRKMEEYRIKELNTERTLKKYVVIKIL